MTNTHKDGCDDAHPSRNEARGPTTAAGMRKLRDALKKRADKEARRKERNRKKNMARRRARQQRRGFQDSTPFSFWEELAEKEEKHRQKEKKQKNKKKNQASATTQDSDTFDSENLEVELIMLLQTCHKKRTASSYSKLSKLFQAMFNEQSEARAKLKLYKQLSLRFHPDKNSHDTTHFTEIFKALQNARTSAEANI